jgi:hypothetical protein
VTGREFAAEFDQAFLAPSDQDEVAPARGQGAREARAESRRRTGDEGVSVLLRHGAFLGFAPTTARAAP